MMRRKNRSPGFPLARGVKVNIWFVLGMAAMALTILPNLILGEASIFTGHDQLDGEMIAYILQARHLFSGGGLPEFMGGMPKTALTLPAPACVLLFLQGNYFAALVAMQLGGRLAGFAGMYLLSREMSVPPWMAAGAGVLYGLLPFLPVYGLSQYGVPLLFWCVLQIRKGRHLVLSYGYVALFGLTSSLVLVGFGLLGMGALLLLWDFARKKSPWHFLAAWQMLLFVYIAENFRLLLQLLGAGEGAVSHKTEYVLQARPFWGALVQNLLYGGQHSQGYHKMLVTAAMVLLFSALTAGLLSAPEGGKRGVWRWGGDSFLKCMGVCLGWNFLFALAAACWESGVGVALRSRLGVLRAFQLDRLTWIMPCLWYLLVSCCCGFLHSLWKSRRGIARLAAAGGLGVMALAAGAAGIRILMEGDIKSNLGKLFKPDYSLMSYSDYYASDVMGQVGDFLGEYSGKAKEEYRVASFGIDPAAALYNGFYCLDGYSNNYPLEYKHGFRKAIVMELEKSEYLSSYFDGWGNRCYLFSAECPGYYTIKKGGFFFQDCRLDAEALAGMGCSYLLSAAYIQNAEEQGLVLLNEVPFETEDSYYGIYVYKVGK